MKRKIIVIDDSATARYQIASLLSGAGFDIVEAENGHDGLDKIRANRDAALVVSDVNMPGMDGLEMLDQIRGMPELAGLPIIMLTAESEAGSMSRAKLAGAKAWLVKPFKPDLLLAVVNKVARPAAR